MCWMMVLLVMYLYWGASFSVEVVFSMRDCRMVFWVCELVYAERELWRCPKMVACGDFGCRGRTYDDLCIPLCNGAVLVFVCCSQSFLASLEV
jgi:hypothetical protein